MQKRTETPGALPVVCYTNKTENAMFNQYGTQINGNTRHIVLNELDLG